MSMAEESREFAELLIASIATERSLDLPEVKWVEEALDYQVHLAWGSHTVTVVLAKVQVARVSEDLGAMEHFIGQIESAIRRELE